MFHEFREYHENENSVNDDLEEQSLIKQSDTGFKEPQKTVDRELTRIAITEALHEMETQLIFPNDKVLHAAEDPDFRYKLLSTNSPNTNSIERLHSLRKELSLNPTNFTKIPDLQTYQAALRAFPLIQEHPQFDKLHRQTKLYFLIRESYPLYSDKKLPTG